MGRVIINASQKTKINSQITAKVVRYVDENGEMVGVITLSEALKRAEAASLDLVEVAPDAEPPVCKAKDYGRYSYQKKKQHKNKSAKKTLKEIKFRPVIDVGDFNIKLRKIKEFLDFGNKVKISIRFKGREMAHQELGQDLIDKIVEALDDKGKVDLIPKLEGRQIVFTISPK